MFRARTPLAFASFVFALWAVPAMAQSPKPPPFRPFPAGPVVGSGTPKPPPFRPRPPLVQPGQPIPPVVLPGNPGTPPTTPEDEQQRRRRFFFLMMLRQQALTRAALQQAAFATALANQASYQAASSYPQSYPYPMSYPSPMSPARREQPPAAEPTLLAGMVDAEGKVAWPLGLQIVRPALETKTIRERIDGLVRVAARQAASGQHPRGVLDETKQLVGELRKAFDASRQDMPERTAQDADAFLTRLSTSLQSMQGGERPAAYDDAGRKKY